jgi:hypothetical protein
MNIVNTDKFHVKRYQRNDDTHKNHVDLLFHSYYQDKKVGQAALNINHNERDIIWTSFEPLSASRELRNQNLGTLAHGVILFGTILTEYIAPDYKVFHDTESPLCNKSCFQRMGLSQGLDVVDYLSRYTKYAISKGFCF